MGSSSGDGDACILNQRQPGPVTLSNAGNVRMAAVNEGSDVLGEQEDDRTKVMNTSQDELCVKSGELADAIASSGCNRDLAQDDDDNDDDSDDEQVELVSDLTSVAPLLKHAGARNSDTVTGATAADLNNEADNQHYEKYVNGATEDGDEETIALLSRVDPCMRSAAQGTTALWFASFNGNIDSVKTLLSDPFVDPAAEDNAAIRLACLAGNADAVKLLLLDPRVNPAAVDDYAFWNASANGHRCRPNPRQWHRCSV